MKDHWIAFSVAMVLALLFMLVLKTWSDHQCPPGQRHMRELYGQWECISEPKKEHK